MKFAIPFLMFVAMGFRPTFVMADNLFASELNSGNIYVFDTASASPQTPGSPFVTVVSPSASTLAFDNNGNLFAGSGNGIYEFIFTGGQLSSTPNTFVNGPIIRSLAIDNNGNLYARTFGSINKYDANGNGGIFAGAPGPPRGLAFDSNWNLFASVGGNIDEFINTGGNLSSTPVIFASSVVALSLAFDHSGNLFAAVGGNILSFDVNGNQSTFATGLNPSSLAFDSAGNLFEADTSSGVINEFTNISGILSSTPTPIVSGLNGSVAITFEPAAVPESSTWSLLAIGMGFLLILRRKFAT